ncbi:MAG: hypothetical protein JO172_14735 [Hyphomicrobiales bacterium]|nr:hypothetical protein [Hyphomicrobiales bacterium]
MKAKAEPADAKPEAARTTSGHDDAGIAARAAAAVEAANARAVDTGKFQQLKQPVGEADDLKLISGVGPAIEKKLNSTGIWHYWQVKALSAEDIDKVEQEAGLKGRAHRDDWVGQATDLMAGKGPRHK